jgi:hypothetical protein
VGFCFIPWDEFDRWVAFWKSRSLACYKESKISNCHDCCSRNL